MKHTGVALTFRGTIFKHAWVLCCEKRRVVACFIWVLLKVERPCLARTDERRRNTG